MLGPIVFSSKQNLVTLLVLGCSSAGTTARSRQPLRHLRSSRTALSFRRARDFHCRPPHGAKCTTRFYGHARVLPLVKLRSPVDMRVAALAGVTRGAGPVARVECLVTARRWVVPSTLPNPHFMPHVAKASLISFYLITTL
jgi:hypothetical protein